MAAIYSAESSFEREHAGVIPVSFPFMIEPTIAIYRLPLNLNDLKAEQPRCTVGFSQCFLNQIALPSNSGNVHPRQMVVWRCRGGAIVLSTIRCIGEMLAAVALWQ